MKTCRTPITTRWHMKAMNRCPLDPPVRHRLWSLSDIFSGWKEESVRISVSLPSLVPVGKFTALICQTEEEQQLGSLPFFQPPFSAFFWIVPAGHATGPSHPGQYEADLSQQVFATHSNWNCNCRSETHWKLADTALLWLGRSRLMRAACLPCRNTALF